MKVILVGAIVLATGCAQRAGDDVSSSKPLTSESRANSSLPAKVETQVQESKPDASIPIAAAPTAPDKKSAQAATVTDEKKQAPALTPLTADDQSKLLKRRVDGKMELPFRQLANKFFVFSRLSTGYCVGLMTSSKEIADAELQSPFPASYKPTLQEFLDAIALQTFSTWKYDPSEKFFKSEVETEAPARELAIFEFTQVKRKKNFEVTLAAGWKSVDRGHWLTCTPPTFPVGMDIYEMGKYSADDATQEQEFLQSVPKAVALDWAKRVDEDAQPDDLKPAKVGEFDAVYFEKMIKAINGQQVRWRHWVFIDRKQCYFIVSTIFPDREEELFPDVEKMLASFRIKKP